MKNSGFDITSSRRKQIKIIKEALLGIGEIILSNTQKKYIKEYASNDKKLRFAVADGSFKALYPRYALEAIFLLLALLTFSLIIFTNQNPEFILIGVGTGALTAQRLLHLFNKFMQDLLNSLYILFLLKMFWRYLNWKMMNLIETKDI